MEYGPKPIELGGLRLTLRSPGGADAAAMIAYLKKACGETVFLLNYPDEVTYTEAEETALLERWRSAADQVMVGVFDGDRPVGTVSLSGVGPKSKLRHRAVLGITVLRELWGLGLGRLLMREAEVLARSMGFSQIELGVFSDNRRAIHLYETEGYTVYGRVPGAFHLRDGTVQDELLMAKDLSRPAS